MTDEEKRDHRERLKKIRSSVQKSLEQLDVQIGVLCHTFTEEDLIKNGWVKHNFNLALQSYEYRKGNKSVNLRDTGDVTTYSGKPTRWLEDIQDLIDYETE